MKDDFKCVERFGDIYPMLTAGSVVRIRSKKTGYIIMTLEKNAIDCACVVDRLRFLWIDEIRAINTDTIILTVDDTNYEEGEE